MYVSVNILDFSHSWIMFHCVCVCVCVCVRAHSSSVVQLCPTFWDPMDSSLQGHPDHGIFQARILEWLAISSSRGSSWPKNQNPVSCVFCIAGDYYWASWNIFFIHLLAVWNNMDEPWAHYAEWDKSDRER